MTRKLLLRLPITSKFLRALFLIIVLTSPSGCGGGDDDAGEPFTPGSGRWSGQMRQLGGVSCSDGSNLGVGAGAQTREIILLVRGGDTVGAVATLFFEDCEYIGFRSSADRMTFRSDQQRCFSEIDFRGIRLDSAVVHLLPQSASTQTSGQVNCRIAEEGEVIRRP